MLSLYDLCYKFSLDFFGTEDTNKEDFYNWDEKYGRAPLSLASFVLGETAMEAWIW